MCKQVISKINIILALILPLITIGFITLIIGIAINSNTLILLSLINISGAAGDIMMTTAILRMKNVQYFDTDDTTSFYIISENDLLQRKYLGLNIKETGIYNSDITAKDYQKIKITKVSWYIIAVLILLTVILNFMKRGIL
jgi:hypothetical protein